jgi:hypothetical protein
VGGCRTRVRGLPPACARVLRARFQRTLARATCKARRVCSARKPMRSSWNRRCARATACIEYAQYRQSHASIAHERAMTRRNGESVGGPSIKPSIKRARAHRLAKSRRLPRTAACERVRAEPTVTAGHGTRNDIILWHTQWRQGDRSHDDLIGRRRDEYQVGERPHVARVRPVARARLGVLQPKRTSQERSTRIWLLSWHSPSIAPTIAHAGKRFARTPRTRSTASRSGGVRTRRARRVRRARA